MSWPEITEPTIALAGPWPSPPRDARPMRAEMPPSAEALLQPIRAAVDDLSQRLTQIETSGGVMDYAAVQAVDDRLTTHIIDPEPHPAYDDLPDLSLIYRAATI